MKAERRHQLKTNTLDQVLTGAPDVGRKYGGMLLLIVLAAAAAYLLVRYRINAARDAERTATENLTAARMSISQLGQLNMIPIPGAQKVEYRKQWSDEARGAIDNVMQTANEPRLLAEALLAKGDLSWALAQLEEPAEAATRPSLKFEATPKQLLGEAEAAYDQVRTQYGNQHAAVIAANFGLAAVYENLGDWEKAKARYKAIIDDPTATEAYKTQADIRLAKAADWAKPVLLVPTTQAAAIEASPATAPTTRPATAPTTTKAATTAPAR